MICPICESQQTVEGQVRGTGEYTGSLKFFPDGLRFFTLRKAINLVFTSFSACLSCGHLWSKVSPAELTDLLERSASNDLKSKLSNSPASTDLQTGQ